MSYLEEIGANGSHGSKEGGGADSLKTPITKDEVTYGGAAVGDLIQWEANGSLQLPKPARVRAVTEDGDWVFVENSETGIPMNQVIVQEKSEVKPPVLALGEAPKGTRREVFTLDEGDVVLTFPDNLTAASYADLESYLQLFLRKAKRRAGDA